MWRSEVNPETTLFGSVLLDEVSPCPGTGQFSWAGWPGSPRDPLISVFPGMGLKRWSLPCL